MLHVFKSTKRSCAHLEKRNVFVVYILKMQGVCTACFEKAIRSLCGFQNVQRDCFAFKKTQSVHVARFEILKVNELLL